MPRLRKLRRKQKYQYHVNRRRLNQKKKTLPRINCDIIREAWDDKKSVASNLTSLGLVADPNNYKTLKIPSAKELVGPAKHTAEEQEASSSHQQPPVTVKRLEDSARKKFIEKKSVAHPLPPEMYKKLTRFLDKYGEDFEAMSRDHGNYYQETPTQLKAQVNRLKKIPQQWVPYLKSRGLINPELTPENENMDI